MPSHRKPQQLPPSVAKNKKCEELLKGNRRTTIAPSLVLVRTDYARQTQELETPMDSATLWYIEQPPLGLGRRKMRKLNTCNANINSRSRHLRTSGWRPTSAHAEYRMKIRY
jgi:hypothetical protein